MYISAINYESIVDGKGLRTTIFVSGCKHNCKNCFNPETHRFDSGKLLTEELIKEMSEEMRKNKMLAGLTISGGDCFYQPLETIELIKKLYIPKNNIWCYTGFTWEEIIQDKDMAQLLKYINVLVDGRYIEELHDYTIPFRGSSNQRIIDVQKSLKSCKIYIFEEVA